MSEQDPYAHLNDEELTELLRAENAQEVAAAQQEQREEAINAPVTYTHDIEGGLYTFAVGATGDNYLEIVHHPGQSEAHVDNFGVDDSLRRSGIGTRMLFGAGALLQDRGVTTLYSSSLTPDALRVAGKLIGEDNMTIYDADNPEASANAAWAMTLEQAVMSSGLAQDYNAALEQEQLTARANGEPYPERQPVDHLMGIIVPIGHIDLSTIDRPQER